MQLSRRMLLGMTLGVMTERLFAGTDAADTFATAVDDIQRRIGGRVGVSVRDTHSGEGWHFHAEERFAMCSTFKLLLAAHVLHQTDQGMLKLDDKLRYSAKDLLANSPVSTQRLSEGALSIGDLAAAAIRFSDNTAANLLLRRTGDPAGLTGFLRSIGDTTTRLDREETQLNTNLRDDPRDTTTPAAMSSTVATLFTTDALTADSRTQLASWLKTSRTGLRRLRAGLPSTWMIGDKTGTGSNGALNDVLIAWPPQRAPLIAAVFLSDSSTTVESLEEAHAQIGALIARQVA